MDQKEKMVAIHQPNCFPWLGYWEKIIRSDCFVFLDDVQLPKTGGSWVNRAKLLIHQEAKWFTLPIDRSYHGTRAINKVQISMPPSERYRLADSVRQTYRKAPYYAEVFPVLEPLLNHPESNLAQFNIHAIATIADRMGIPGTRFVCSSSLDVVGEVSTARLVSIVQKVGGSEYLYGGLAAQAYQDNEQFFAAGVAPIAQEFEHPVYSQFNTERFVPGLSIIDALMNLGFGGVSNLLSARG